MPNTVPLFSVGENHDFLIRDEESYFDYWNLQNVFLERNESLGFNIGIHETGCVDFDEERNNIYINDGSVCPTTYK